MAAESLSIEYDNTNPKRVVFRGGAGPAVYFGGVTLDFGDKVTERVCGPGQSCEQREISHIYPKEGTYKASLIAFGEGQRKVLSEITVTIGSRHRVK